MSSAEFWRPWEEEISSFDEINDVLTRIFRRWIQGGRVFAWRGIVNADWPLHSSLYRRVLWSLPPGSAAPNEESLERQEGDVLKGVHRWGLHVGERGRLSVLAQLATLQHFGAPTRLIDISFNAYIGLWFAVEEQFSNGDSIHDDVDGRLFAVDVSRRLINEDDESRNWEDDLRRPWRDLTSREWCTTVWAWKPPALQARISSQHGGFLLGGVPAAVAPPEKVGAFRFPKSAEQNDGRWLIDEARRSTSLALRMHKIGPKAGGVGEAGQPAYTFRIKASAKKEIRARLGQLFGYSHATIYPDYPGFAQFALRTLKSRP